MYHINQEWWYMPIMSALGKWRQEVRGSRYLLLHSKFEASSGYLRLYQKKKKSQRQDGEQYGKKENFLPEAMNKVHGLSQ